MIDTYMGTAGVWILPCPACGVPYERLDGCASVVCKVPACRTAWTFSPDYVPRRGIMIDLKLFAPLAPGTLYASRDELRARLRINRQALGH